MSAGVCGKRLGFEEIFGSSTPTSSAKRARCSSFGSPIRSADFGFGSEDKVSLLLRMFPSMDREVVRAEIFFVLSFLVVETVLNTHNHNIEDAIESLHALCLGSISAKNEAQNLDPMVIANCPTGFRSAHPGNESCQISEQETENLEDSNSTCEGKNAASGTAWIDIFVQEMMNATDLDDARGRAATILEAFERNVVAQARTLEEEIASLRENLQSLLKDNQILKRAVAIQHERNLEQEEKVREVQQLKNLISQYQEQVRTLELNNYTLTLHLQRAQESSSIPGHFHPDVF